MNNLFLICPDCHIENAIREEYSEVGFFLTALGSVFNEDTFEYAEQINQLIAGEEIGQIYIVNDFYCTFIQNIINGDPTHNTNAEEVLMSILADNQEEFNESDTTKENKALILAKLNIYRQSKELLDLAFIGDKIRDKQIEIKGLIYNRHNGQFDEFSIQL
jgi:hypothetical protein